MSARVVVITAALASSGCDAIFSVDEPRMIDAPAGIDASDAPAPDTSLLAHWPFDALGTAGAVDVAGGRSLGCVGQGCPTPVTSDRGGGLHFSGDQLLQVEGSGVLRTTAEFTVMAWVRISQAPGAYMCPFGKLHGTDGDNSWQFCFSATSTSFYTTTGSASSSTPLVSNAWQHVALTWDGTTARLLVDANPRASAELEPTAFDDGRILVGYDEDGGAMSAPFTGDLDDMRIYTRALGPTEILSLVLVSM